MEGFAYVGSGDDNDPFIMGVTTKRLLMNCALYSSSEHRGMFHADATFKLSDIGYPVITFGFTDEARSYQVAAVFVVSRRTQYEYAQCFRSLARVMRNVCGAVLDIDKVMSDAEDAQYLGTLEVPEFSVALMLMCFFHVLYNVRKKTNHLGPDDRRLIMTSIIGMHFCESLHEFYVCRDEELRKWRLRKHLVAFAEYFSKQWLSGRFWRWQIFHSPSGYATTNNPCEVFNASIKQFTKRRLLRTKLLLQKLGDLLGTVQTIQPVPAPYVPTPSPDVVEAARRMLAQTRVRVLDTHDAYCVRVLQIDRTRREQRSGDRSRREESSSEDSDNSACTPSSDDTGGIAGFVQIFDSLGGSAKPPAEAPHPNQENGDGESDQLHSYKGEDTNDEIKRVGTEIYKRVVKWSLWRSHRMGMPLEGWIVNLKFSTCGCKYFIKFKICAHLVVARNAKNMTQPGIDDSRKLKNRRVNSKTKAKGLDSRRSKKTTQSCGRKTKKSSASAKKSSVSAKRVGKPKRSKSQTLDMSRVPMQNDVLEETHYSAEYDHPSYYRSTDADKQHRFNNSQCYSPQQYTFDAANRASLADAFSFRPSIDADADHFFPSQMEHSQRRHGQSNLANQSHSTYSVANYDYEYFRSRAHNDYESSYHQPASRHCIRDNSHRMSASHRFSYDAISGQTPALMDQQTPPSSAPSLGANRTDNHQEQRFRFNWEEVTRKGQSSLAAIEGIDGLSIYLPGFIVCIRRFANKTAWMTIAGDCASQSQRTRCLRQSQISSMVTSVGNDALKEKQKV